MPRTDAEPGPDEGQRLDKWLWYARIAKTRSLATRLVEAGKARVNKARVSKASRVVRPGDVITLAVHEQVKVLKIIACGVRRGPAPEARELYEDLSPPPVPRVRRLRILPAAQREKGAGRPTKRDRRRIDAWQTNADEPPSEDGEDH